ncbi:TRAP transporter small permease [Salinicola peritrichatus]|uniref:TRAP transporter small permease n=1 Tax=Salinicola peritrichatus TaxID=1267424 RepID=UPI000DA176CE|nr:TRAP transporter small permease [Salinicola peritrichatus]
MLNTLVKGIDHAVKHLTFLLFIAMVIAVFGQVVMRYLFGTSVFWAEEFARYAMVWIAFLGASMGVVEGAHTKIDFFINRLPQGVKKGVFIFNNVLCILFLSCISYYVVAALSYTMGTLSPAMRIPMGLMHLILPVSGVLMSVYLLIDTYRLLRNQPFPAE